MGGGLLPKSITMKSLALAQSAHRSAIPTALVVNADSRVRSAYVSVLKANAFATEESSDGRVALAMAIATRPDVIVTETRLAGIDGFQLCTLLRRDPDTCAAAILVVTDEAAPHEIERAKAAGADTVLIQPCPSERLLAETQRLLQSKEVAQAGWLPRQIAKASLESGGGDPVHREQEAENATADLLEAPPELLCPDCLSPLVFERSHLGGLRHAGREQWDEFRCIRKCGLFRYRHRTRKLARIVV